MTPEYVQMQEKKAEALRLVKQGHRLPEIARRLGYAHPQGAHKLINSALQELVEGPREEARAVCLARLDDWLTRIHPLIEMGDLKAIAIGLKIEERRARLQGLDAPVTVQNPSGGPAIAFLVQVPPQAPTLADWQAQAEQVIDVNPLPSEESDDEETKP